MEHKIKPFGFSRIWDYIKANFIIMFKSLIEYKKNLFWGFLAQLFFLITNILVLLIIAENFGFIVGWDKYDFILYILFVDLINMIGGIFTWSKPLFQVINDGRLNLYLIRPIKPFFGLTFSNLDGPAFIMILMNLILISILLYSKITLFSLGIIIILVFIFSFFFFLLISFIFSFEFHKKGLSVPSMKFLQSIGQTQGMYPINFFETFKFKFILFFVMNAYIAIFIIEFIKIQNISVFLRYEIILFFVFLFIFIFGTFINWHYGLKKYEAYG